MSRWLTLIWFFLIGSERLLAAQAVDVAVYYFPQYHQDPQNDKRHGKGWTEWEIVKHATPRFPGHQQPKVPLWGYLDESRPEVAEKYIGAAADHGVTVFIYDWYYYEAGLFLKGALEEGFLKAKNNNRLKFSLMWANHDLIDVHPAKFDTRGRLHAAGAVSRKRFDQMADYVIKTYFKHPSYWKIEEKPYFSIYELNTLMKGLGGLEETKKALESFRSKVKAAGFPDLHLNAVLFGVAILPGEEAIQNPDQLLNVLKFDSCTSYTWAHHTALDSFPTISYKEYSEKSVSEWDRISNEIAIPYYPNVTMGWDSSPRSCQTDIYEQGDYPFTSVLVGNTPEEFSKALAKAKKFVLESGLKEKIVTINSWNEWTEGSYLEPDKVNGLKYLEAVKEVFSKL